MVCGSGELLAGTFQMRVTHASTCGEQQTSLNDSAGQKSHCKALLNNLYASKSQHQAYKI